MPDRRNEDTRYRRLFAELEQSPVFNRHIRAPAPDPRVLKQSRATWMGVGILGRTVSQALPIDALVMVLAQEIVRRTLELDESYILIADSNARSVGADPGEVEAAFRRTRQTIETVCAHFGFPVNVVAASQVGDRAQLARLADKVDGPNRYVQLQIAQMEQMRRMGANVKVGWAMSGGTHDERYFDELYEQQFGHHNAFVYTPGGRSLDLRRPRCCPYVCENRASRLVLDGNERLAHKLKAADKVHVPLVKAYRHLVNRIVRVHRKLVAPQRSGPPVQRLQALLDDMFSEESRPAARVTAAAPTL